MDFVSGLALILLTLVGYSGGAVVAGKGKQVIPGLLDLVVVVLLWVLALATRAGLGREWAILVWLVVGLMMGMGLTGLRRARYPGRRERMPVAMQGPGGLRRWWQTWKAFATELGSYQGRVLLAFFYFTIVAPFGFFTCLFGDPLRLRRAGGSAWVERHLSEQGVEKAREQS